MSDYAHETQQAVAELLAKLDSLPLTIKAYMEKLQTPVLSKDLVEQLKQASIAFTTAGQEFDQLKKLQAIGNRLSEEMAKFETAAKKLQAASESTKTAAQALAVHLKIIG